MKTKKAIETLDYIKYCNDYNGCRESIAIEMAKIALEKQIELEPMYRWGVIDYCPPDYGGEEYDEYGWIPSCPRCTRVIDNFTTRCECGQAIKRNKTYPTETME